MRISFNRNISRGAKRIVLVCFINILAFLAFKISFALEPIIIDPGHGGEDTGCIGPNGTMEKDINLQIAKKLAGFIGNRLEVNTILTRRGDYSVDLVERAAIANNNYGRVFISIHANSSFSLEQTGQIMIFVASRLSSDSDGPSKREGILPWDSINQMHYEESYNLASILEQEARKSGIWRESIIRDAPILVLLGADMPAIEVELDFLSSSLGEDRLKNEWYQEKMCEVLYRAIVRFQHKYIREGDPNAFW